MTRLSTILVWCAVAILFACAIIDTTIRSLAPAGSAAQTLTDKDDK
jgi:hypothetical protein